MTFVIRLLALCALGHALVSSAAVDLGPIAGSALAAVLWLVYACCSGVIRNRRLIHKLGGLHRIFANADNINHLPFLMRSHEEHVRWWQRQLAYELGLGLVILLPLPIYAFAVGVSRWWLVGAAVLPALLILTAPTLLRIYDLTWGRQGRR